LFTSSGFLGLHFQKENAVRRKDILTISHVDPTEGRVFLSEPGSGRVIYSIPLGKGNTVGITPGSWFPKSAVEELQRRNASVAQQ